MNPETIIQNEIIREFGTDPRLRIWRNNTGAAVYQGRGRQRQKVTFGVPGQADITGLLPDGRRLEIEVKTPTGRQEPEQKQFQAMIERFGGLYILARSVQDVRDALAGLI